MIQSLNFGATTFHPPLLCVSSDKGTAHVFAIEGEPKECVARGDDARDGNGNDAREGETSSTSATTTVSSALAKYDAGKRDVAPTVDEAMLARMCDVPFAEYHTRPALCPCDLLWRPPFWSCIGACHRLHPRMVRC